MMKTIVFRSYPVGWRGAKPCYGRSLDSRIPHCAQYAIKTHILRAKGTSLGGSRCTPVARGRDARTTARWRIVIESLVEGEGFGVLTPVETL